MKQASISSSQTPIFTFGYQALTLREFLSVLSRNGVKRIIDIRFNPISRKPGFSKKALCSGARKIGIDYIHMGQLGIDGKKRKNLKTENDYNILLDEYETSLDNGLAVAVEQAAILACETPSVLICYESDSNMCHRSRLAKILNKKFQFQTEHLQVR